MNRTYHEKKPYKKIHLLLYYPPLFAALVSAVLAAQEYNKLGKLAAQLAEAILAWFAIIILLALIIDYQ